MQNIVRTANELNEIVTIIDTKIKNGQSIANDYIRFLDLLDIFYDYVNNDIIPIVKQTNELLEQLNIAKKYFESKIIFLKKE